MDGDEITYLRLTIKELIDESKDIDILYLIKSLLTTQKEDAT